MSNCSRTTQTGGIHSTAANVNPAVRRSDENQESSHVPVIPQSNDDSINPPSAPSIVDMNHIWSSVEVVPVYFDETCTPSGTPGMHSQQECPPEPPSSQQQSHSQERLPPLVMMNKPPIATSAFVEVVAPADLTGGYRFSVDAGTQSLLVEVVSVGFVLDFFILEP